MLLYFLFLLSLVNAEHQPLLCYKNTTESYDVFTKECYMRNQELKLIQLDILVKEDWFVNGVGLTTVCAICLTWLVSFCLWTRWAMLSHIADVVCSCFCLVFGFRARVFLAAPAELPSCSALRLWQDLCRTVARFESGSAVASHLPRFKQFCVFSVFRR